MLDITGKDIAGPYLHSCPIMELSLSQGLVTSDRLLGLIDKNRDLFIISVVPKPSQPRKSDKLGR